MSLKPYLLYIKRNHSLPFSFSKRYPAPTFVKKYFIILYKNVSYFVLKNF